MRNLPLALPGVWELYPSTGRKVTVRNCYFRQSDFGTPEAVTQGVRDTQYQQATPLDSQTDFPSVPSCGSLSGKFPETLVKKCRKNKSAGKEVGTMQVQIEVKEKKKDRKRMEQYLEQWKKKGGHNHAGC